MVVNSPIPTITPYYTKIVIHSSCRDKYLFMNSTSDFGVYCLT